jgi:hypothetical protein
MVPRLIHWPVINRIAVKYLDQAHRKYEENPEILATQEPFLFHLLDNKQLSETEVNLLITEIFQGGIDAVTAFSLLLHSAIVY